MIYFNAKVNTILYDFLFCDAIVYLYLVIYTFSANCLFCVSVFSYKKNFVDLSFLYSC